MENRWFNLLIVLTWVSTTTWLVVAKVVPPLKRGEPPNYRSMYSLPEAETSDVVGWEMTLNGKSLGWALSRIDRAAGNMPRVHSHIHFEQIPLEELAPPWMKNLIRTAVRPGEIE